MSHDVLLLMSTEHLYDAVDPRMDLLQTYFQVEEGPAHRFKFRASNQTDTLQLFRLSRRIEVFTAPAPSSSIVAETEQSIFNFTEKVAILRRLEDKMWGELDESKSKRAKTKKE